MIEMIDPHQDILEIKDKLSTIHTDLKRLIERSSQQHLESIISGLQRDFSNGIVGYLDHQADKDLENNMIKECEMRGTCKSKFKCFLQNNADLIKHSNIDENIIVQNRSELMEMKSNAPSEQCDICFSEVSNVLEKQISLMRSLQIYHKEEESKQHIPEIAEEAIVKDVLEPLSNKQRFRILKAVSMETKTFTALSELTKLRGGNLLFHLQKLLDNGLIIQRHERGDYMITEKGYTIFKGVNDIYSRLKS